MRHQAIRPLALMLAVLLLGAAPARAASLTFEDVARAVGPHGQLRPADEVRLRLVQSGSAAAQTAQPQQPPESSAAQPQTDAAPGGGAAPGSAVTGPSLSQSGGGQVETIDLGDVTGTVCDCGEIPVPPRRGGGIPWWPFIGLICVTGICFPDNDDDCPVEPCIPPPPTPTPPPPQIPEPTTLLLFGTGLLALGARARRRYGRKTHDAQTAEDAEEV